MTTLAYRAGLDHAGQTFDPAAALIALWTRFRDRRRERRALVALARRDPRLLEDMGLDPETIYAALDGTTDAVGPAHLSPLLRPEMSKPRRKA
ncbi:hypothetical protein [Antarcticirhabdus aurantiaca]|uniref:Uncharacterized protein n=1 Tax=Antarcticirhabdus aurantiaca TaxID=2606717 RepID=A0ACD4NPY8_9HYPH|nr:hypothetical protein [Antarcticirhabdus aurantiaca]WAJ28989.1 hypothetical protein OXU80_01690 [Jeongeuplla avenae]